MARSYNNHSFLDYISYFSMPIHLFFFISILFSILCLSWYINYEDKFEDLINQVKLFLMLSPVVLLLLVHCLSSCFPVFLPFPERDSLHRAGGSPWGVALLLVFLIFMISYQSSFHELCQGFVANPKSGLKLVGMKWSMMRCVVTAHP
ncbi:hypothetical protein POPTR_001G009200v4 [Populus trichocarpa]|uniref:Uncharacterized protein n=1 Tax=Populus trichocarpa TaxID=3694 RepID=A0ACC0TGD7_POPTR|nr:hypothetical protein BDE02_01G009300 [Populus trichocarpa]KAI9400615.1 hypothetical protein POPTR_001G009200v4 [Populus trichocarpa]